MANYAQTVNVIGCIKTTGTASAFETTGLVLKMYREYFETTPVTVSGAPEPLDVVAAWSKDKKYLTIAVVNPTREFHNLKCTIPSYNFNSSIDHIFIQNNDDMAFNDPTKGSPVTIKGEKLNGFKNIRVAPLSVNIYRLEFNK
jgi:alpha-L-arabinofuranosidase